MSLDEVEAILGGPAGDYRTQSDIGYLSSPGAGHYPRHPPPGSTTKEWLTDKFAITVEFEPEAEQTHPQVPAANAVTSLTTPSLVSGMMQILAVKRFQDVPALGPEGKVSAARMGVGMRIPSWPERVLNSLYQLF